MNMARHDGPLFAETILQSYIQENNLEKSKYTKSLFRDLKRTTGVQPLQIEEDLTAVAQGHSNKTGKSGRVGHQSFNKLLNHSWGILTTMWERTAPTAMSRPSTLCSRC